MKIISWTILYTFLFVSTGCSSVSYLVQAGKGQFELANRARPISEVLKDPKVSPRIRELLAKIPVIKTFGEEQGLKPTPNYTDYVQLDRPAATWVVSASRPLRFESKIWSFPVVGSFPYLGWFDLKQAKAFAADLRQEGWDVDLRGARAFSTLGWFKDSVLSSMIPDGDEALGELANVVIHESVHATVYVNGQSSFNESLASFVADRLTPVFLAHSEGQDSPALKSYIAGEKTGEERTRELHQAYLGLDALYSSGAIDSEKMERKQKLLAELKAKLGFSREINNATLIQYKTYATGDDEFAAFLQECAGDIARFMNALGRLKPESFGSSQAQSFSQVFATLKGC